MPTLDKILERKKEVSGQVSAQTRASALGLLAISWALLTAHDDPLKTMATHAHRGAVLGMSVLGCLILACDLLQYVFYTRDADKTKQEAEKAADKTAQYDTSSFVHRAGAAMYFAKFFFLIVGAGLLVWIFADLASAL